MKKISNKDKFIEKLEKSDKRTIARLITLIENEDLTSVYGTTQDKAMMFHRQNQDAFNSKCVPAIERYTGVVYNHIEYVIV